MTAYPKLAEQALAQILLGILTSNQAESMGRQASTRGSKKVNPVPDDSPKPWTFLTNHAHVLIVLDGQPGLVLREVAIQVGITERAVQRIVQDLEDQGYLRREKVGRKNEYEVNADAMLRHPIEAHRKIGDLLKLISG